jgi:hypothetical protein
MLKASVMAVVVIVTAIFTAGALALSQGNSMGMGASSTISHPAFQGYYDGHKVTYLNTDVSSKTEARMLHVNYSASIGRVKGLPEIYLVQGRGAVGQIAIFGSEPGESDYSPLWSETLLHWKPGATPIVIKSDTQINQIEKTGKLTESDAHVILNCPIIKVG